MNRCHKILQSMSSALQSSNCRQQSVPCWGQTDVYTVAVIYARLLEHYFRNPAEEYLLDPALLSHPSFKPLPEHSDQYNALLSQLTISAILATNNLTTLDIIARFNVDYMIGSCEFKMMTTEAKRKA